HLPRSTPCFASSEEVHGNMLATRLISRKPQGEAWLILTTLAAVEHDEVAHAAPLFGRIEIVSDLACGRDDRRHAIGKEKRFAIHIDKAQRLDSTFDHRVGAKPERLGEGRDGAKQARA